MPRLQRSLVALFSLLIMAVLTPPKALALGLSPAFGSGDAHCQIVGGNTGGSPDVDNPYSSQETTATTSCDLAASLPDGQFLHSTGTSLTTLGLSPAADVQGSAQSSVPPFEQAPLDTRVYLTSLATFYTSIHLTALPAPHPVDGIPVIMSWTGETHVTGGAVATIAAEVGNGGFVGTPGVIGFTFAPGEQYSAAVEATCYAEAQGNASSSCQAVADPVFTFDQAKFDAEMATNTFPLADYYQFEFSPNLVPEPSSLMLLGSGVAALAIACRCRRS